MESPNASLVTQLLQSANQGDTTATSKLLPLVYDELRRLARSKMNVLPAGGTLQPTALVHEAYMRLIGGQNVQWENRRHFFGAAARAMRNILVDGARRRGRIKHGGGRKRVTLDETLVVSKSPSSSLISLDEALQRLEEYDQRKSEVVMLRYFAGLTIDDTASAMGISTATVEREWAYSKAWLHRELEGTRETPEKDEG